MITLGETLLPLRGGGCPAAGGSGGGGEGGGYTWGPTVILGVHQGLMTPRCYTVFLGFAPCSAPW